MRKSDWLDVGLKILGAFFLVIGVRDAVQALVVMGVADSRGFPGPGWSSLLFPMLEIVAGLVLIVVPWKVTEPPGLIRKPPPPEGLEDLPERPEDPFWQKKAP